MPEQKKLIQFKNIVKSFEDGQVVLKGVSLDIYENEFVTLLGPSGCGKTTLLRILGGFLQPTEGKVLFDGEDIVNVPPYKREINTVFQKYALFPHMNVYDNIAFGLTIKKEPKVVIAQINPHVPFSYGDALIHVSKLTAAVEVDEPLVELPTAQPNEIDRKIGGYIAELIPDGATLQIGVGGIPNAVLAALGDHKHLGLHTEALTDGVVPLIRSGVIDNSQKKVLPGKNLASLALGSKRLYEYMDYNEDLIMKDVAWTNDPFRIRENPKVMAINSALEVDLTGQICADSIGTMIYSSVGGQHDFMYGGALSEGGKTFIALPSTTSKGHSKIKALLTPGAGVVTTRFQTQYVVTEYGAAYLLGKGLAERARALIDIAHPSAREELEKAACERFGYSFLRLK